MSSHPAPQPHSPPSAFSGAVSAAQVAGACCCLGHSCFVADRLHCAGGLADGDSSFSAEAGAACVVAFAVRWTDVLGVLEAAGGGGVVAAGARLGVLRTFTRSALGIASGKEPALPSGALEIRRNRGLGRRQTFLSSRARSLNLVAFRLVPG